ncbi:inorganic pyrophosphatase [Ktedonobacter sp. SOSP1-52]|uniref:putative manganese-dependent inorganic diphosphatase n=1 Tax=Ktedonobacter sp. SOSP1-52 TaxID=2778366 RepID=UPI001916B83C|nr:putative manganese-dependent inorganic diphosphatase [Ktedonobacter sp. SOSP1-52]GHO65774.1 inorganic pyrophosphatase [Ktedonobacter sp. SOSP1-52]
MAQQPIYVIGHKNSDMDSVASAYAYARLLQLQGQENVIPARHGQLKPEIRYALERFQVTPPQALEHIYLQVQDFMRQDVLTAHLNQSLLEAGQMMQEHNRQTMPVVDDENKVYGIITNKDFAKLFFHDLDPQTVNRIPLKRDNLIKVLKGRVLVEGQRELGNRVLVGAMQAESMADYVEPGCLVVIGNREDAQLTAIQRGAAALVITGDLNVSEQVLSAAREQGVMVLSTSYHTFTAVRLINLSICVEDLMEREFASCHPDDLMSDVQGKLQRERSLTVVDNEGKLVGFITRSDILKARPKRIFLVDHNEPSQSIDGAEEAEVLGIIDHHRIANVHTNKPIFFRSEPVGCTGTLIYSLYREADIEIPRDVAGLMLAGLLYDTLILRSPTCTPRDVEVAHKLAAIAQVDLQEFGQAAFEAGASELNDRSAEELLTSDFKEFTVQDVTFAVGTVETASPAVVEKRTNELLETMKLLSQKHNYTSFLFMIVDIINMNCRLLIHGYEDATADAFNVPLEAGGHSIMVEGMVSRKKQMVPQLSHIQHLIANHAGVH